MNAPAWKTIARMAGISSVMFFAGVDLQSATYRSPLAVAVSPDGGTLYVSDRTGDCVTVIDAAQGTLIGEVALPGEPNGLALSRDGKKLYVALRKINTIAVIGLPDGGVSKRIAVGAWPVAVAVDETRKRLWCCNRGEDTVSVVDLEEGREIGRIPVTREPAFVAIAGDGSRALVCNFLPKGAGTDRRLGAEVDIVNPGTMRRIARIKLPPGSTMAGGAWISPDARWAYVTHILGRFTFPVTRLEEGWVHAHALSVIDLRQGVRLATLLLDDLTKGAADPWAVTGTRDGRTLWISHRGVHEVSQIEIGLIHELLSGAIPSAIAEIRDGRRENIWVRIKLDRGCIAELENDLTALHIAGAVRRTASGGLGPCGLTLSPDEKQLYVANYYSGTVGVLDTAAGKLLRTIAPGPQLEPDAARRGEIYFHDATRCFQRWHSCASCHLDGGRVDGLPWDFLRDGIDNGKDVISLVGLFHTAPYSWRAVRHSERECIETGVAGSHMIDADEEDVNELLAYIGSLVPEPNPNRLKIAAAADRGRVLFHGRGDCAGCHPPPYFTDGKTHDVGVGSSTEPGAVYNTPSLIEAYRTAPYFHDGRAVTVKEALMDSGTWEKHGNLKELSPREIEDLAAYVLSL